MYHKAGLAARRLERIIANIKKNRATPLLLPLLASMSRPVATRSSVVSSVLSLQVPLLWFCKRGVMKEKRRIVFKVICFS